MLNHSFFRVSLLTENSTVHDSFHVCSTNPSGLLLLRLNKRTFLIFSVVRLFRVQSFSNGEGQSSFSFYHLFGRLIPTSDKKTLSSHSNGLPKVLSFIQSIRVYKPKIPGYRKLFVPRYPIRPHLTHLNYKLKEVVFRRRL